MVVKTLVSFGAGAVGFLSPCVLPLLPGYVGFMSGAAAGERVDWRKALPATLAFVAGISVVFISLGAAASAISGVLAGHRRLLEVASGVFIIALGAFMVAAASGRVTWFMQERRFHVRPRVGPAPAFLLGAAFAFGWTPCIGPTLGAALNLAATSEGLAQGVGLLAAYSAGMGLPFVLAGLGLISFGGSLKRRAATIQLVGGMILVVVGILVLTGQLTMITRWMQQMLAEIGWDFWNF